MVQTSIQSSGHGHHDVGAAEAKPGEKRDLRFPVGDCLVHEVLAGDAEMRVSGGKLARNLSGGEEDDLDVALDFIGADDTAAIAARVALLDMQAGAREQRLGILHEPALGGKRQDERAVHARGLDLIEPHGEADGGHRLRCAEQLHHAVVAAAADQAARQGRRRVSRRQGRCNSRADGRSPPRSGSRRKTRVPLSLWRVLRRSRALPKDQGRAASRTRGARRSPERAQHRASGTLRRSLRRARRSQRRGWRAWRGSARRFLAARGLRLPGGRARRDARR